MIHTTINTPSILTMGFPHTLAHHLTNVSLEPIEFKPLGDTRGLQQYVAVHSAHDTHTHCPTFVEGFTIVAGTQRAHVDFEELLRLWHKSWDEELDHKMECEIDEFFEELRKLI